MTVASIRYNNPGAMWGNALAIKWGAEKKAVTLNDGLGQGNNIAVFPTPVQGASAQFALWQQSYTGMALSAAIRKWSGGNWSQPYATFLTKETGLSMTTPVTTALLASPVGWKLMKAQAQWEAGQPYPMTDAQWQEAQTAVFGHQATHLAPTPIKPTTDLPKPSQPLFKGSSSILDTVKGWFSGKK